MGKIKWYCNAWSVFEAEPLLRYPGMRPHAQATLAEFLVETIDAGLEPRPLNRDPEILETKLEKLLVRQIGPGKLSRHQSRKTLGTWRRETVSRRRQRHKSGRAPTQCQPLSR